MGRLVTRSSIGAGSWQLAAGHYIAAKMAMQVVHPRPDGETNVYARCRRCPSDIEWSIPVDVQGGAWPFYYEVLTGPVGMAFIRQTVPSDFHTNGRQGYGVLRWVTPTIGTHSVTVQVSGQGGSSVTRSFTLEVIDKTNTTYFLFVDPVGGSNGNSGAYASPYLNHAGWRGNSGNATKQVFYRTGTVLVSTGSPGGSSGQQLAFGSGLAKVHVAYPGETVLLDNEDTAYFDIQSGAGDFCFQGFRMSGPSVPENAVVRKQFIRGGASSIVRSIFHNIRFIGNDDAAADDSNSSVIMIQNSTNASYFSITDCIFDNCDQMDTVLAYSCSDGVFEGNSFVNGYEGEAWGFFAKGGLIERWSIRANYGVGAGISDPLFFMSEYIIDAANGKNSIEVCWNNYKSSESSVVAQRAGAVAIGGSLTAVEGHMVDFWSYRNNWHNPYIGLWGMTNAIGGPYTFENDVIHHDGSQTDGFYFGGSTPTNRIVKTSLATGTAMLDASTNLLTGAARTTYLGTHGCEVA